MTNALSIAWTVTRTVAYLLVAVAGGAILVNPPDPYEGMGLALALAGAVMLLVPGLLAAAGTGLHKYVLEWMALGPMALGILLYSALAWVEVFSTEGTQSLPGAAALLAFTFFFLSRFFQLTIDDKRARLAILARRGGDRG